MTSFQHVIQFHHWKPEGPPVDRGGERPERIDRGSISSQSLRGLFSHKRHKSNDMSIDLLLVQQESYVPDVRTIDPNANVPKIAPPRKQEEEADISMDTSDVTLTEPKESESIDESSHTLNVGRFPHDILLSR